MSSLWKKFNGIFLQCIQTHRYCSGNSCDNSGDYFYYTEIYTEFMGNVMGSHTIFDYLSHHAFFCQTGTNQEKAEKYQL